MIKQVIKFFIPEYAQHILHATREYIYDIKRYVKYSNSYYRLDTQKKYEGLLTLQYHVIEKGLTMPETRLGFGKKAILDLVQICKDFENNKFDINSLAYQHTILILKEYLRFHEEHNYKLDYDVVTKINSVTSSSKKTETAKQKELSSSDYFALKNAPFDQFCLSRYSVRNFIEKEISHQILIECIELANKSPSACNRQPSRVHIVTKKNKILDALQLQSGNRGFGNLSSALLIISSDVSVFQSHKERNEPAFNAGLFSMTLAYALHHKGIGACMLNWSSSKENDTALRKLIGIPDNEAIYVIIACGYVPDKFKIALSPRLRANEIAFFH